MEQGGWELEGKAGDIRGERRREEGVNLEEQGESRGNEDSTRDGSRRVTSEGSEESCFLYLCFF